LVLPLPIGEFGVFLFLLAEIALFKSRVVSLGGIPCNPSSAQTTISFNYKSCYRFGKNTTLTKHAVQRDPGFRWNAPVHHITQTGIIILLVYSTYNFLLSTLEFHQLLLVFNDLLNTVHFTLLSCYLLYT